jgi:predicted nucleotidyltransferase
MRRLRPRVGALKLARKVRARISAELGQPVKVIMYGSQARCDATKYSDIDLFVIVPALNNKTRKLISNIAWEVGFDADKLIQIVPAEERELQLLPVSPFYRSVQKEGIVV